MDDSDIKDTNHLSSKIQLAEPSFLNCKYTENQFLKKYNFILTINAKVRFNKLYTYINIIPFIIEEKMALQYL